MTDDPEATDTNRQPLERSPLLVAAGLATAFLPTAMLYQSVNMLFFVPLVVGLGCVVVGLRKMPHAEWRRPNEFGVVSGLAASCGPFFLAIFLNGSGRPIRIILPRHYRGQVLIVESPEGDGIPVHDGKYVLRVPESGKLLVRSLGPFESWHEQVIEFDDGTVPQCYDHEAHARPEEFGVFELGRGDHSGYALRYFVGTAKQAAETRRQ